VPYAATAIVLLLFASGPLANACGDSAAGLEHEPIAANSTLPLAEVSSAPGLAFAERELAHPSLIIVETQTDGGLAIGYAVRYRAASF
jgi:hypothetical protein